MGKSLRIIRNRVKPANQKYSAFVLTQITGITPLVSRQMRGARDRHERAVRCGGRRRRADVRVGSVRRSRVVRAPRCWRYVGGKCFADNGGKRAVLREEHEVSRKAIAQGRPECSSCPVCSCAVLFAQIARGTAGAASTRSSLRPLYSKRAKEDANLGRKCAARSRKRVFVGWVERSDTHRHTRRR